MGRVIDYPTPSTETAIPVADDRLICDDVETSQNDGWHPARSRGCSLAAENFGMLRMPHLNGITAVLGFANRCIEKAKITTDLSNP